MKTFLAILTVVIVMQADISVFAEELRITIVGGKGGVLFDKNECEHICTYTYPKNTPLYLEAEPGLTFRFLGFIVNGRSSKGNILLEKDTSVKALFAPEKDNLILSDGESKARMALDQICIYWNLDEIKKLSSEQFEEMIREITLKFHPQATSFKSSQRTLELERPVSFFETEWFDAVADLQESEYASFIKEIGPVLHDCDYDYLDHFPDREILVKYSTTATAEDIRQIEEKYGLIILTNKSTEYRIAYTYQANDAFEAIEICNLLEQSEKIKSASPGWSSPPAVPMSQ